jgi:hypothetical protein
VLTTTIFLLLPLITDPDFVILLDAITVINVGTLFGGPELLPESLLHTPPQFGAGPPIELAKPLKADGGVPWLRLFFFAHCEPQK